LTGCTLNWRIGSAPAGAIGADQAIKLFDDPGGTRDRRGRCFEPRGQRLGPQIATRNLCNLKIDAQVAQITVGAPLHRVLSL
jgi:hypothetical protein